MKYLSKITRSGLLKAGALIALVIVLTCCATELLELNQPTEGVVNEPLTITVNYHYTLNDDYANMRMVFALLVPKGWDIRNHATLTYTSPFGPGTLTLMPDNILEKKSGLPWAEALQQKFGIAGNYINDMEWITYQSSDSYEMKNGDKPTGTITITLTPGADNSNTSAKIGYLLSNDNQGLTEQDDFTQDANTLGKYYHQLTGPCLTVTGGTSGETIDFCNVPVTMADPFKALTDDFITFAFLSTVKSTPLDDATEVYLITEAETTTGTKYTVDEHSAKTLTREEAGKIFRFTLWPRSYYGVPEGETIAKIRYHFEDEHGHIWGLNGTEEDITYVLRCQ